jgi:uncharacterized protein (UPF0303 family)
MGYSGSMENYDDILRRLECEQEDLSFTSFGNRKALDIGLALVERARKDELAIAIDIRFHGQQLFHYAFEGTSCDNDEWVRRKSNVVDHFGKSSLYVKYKLLKKGGSIDSVYFLDPMDYSPHGGSFPISITNAGVVGSITVSGLPDEDDHRLVTEVIADYLD